VERRVTCGPRAPQRARRRDRAGPPHPSHGAPSAEKGASWTKASGGEGVDWEESLAGQLSLQEATAHRNVYVHLYKLLWDETRRDETTLTQCHSMTFLVCVQLSHVTSLHVMS